MDILEMIKASEDYQQKLLADVYRPGYHFACPGDDGCPGDPNGAFFADGVYHLMYLYRNHTDNSFHWGHLTSVDLLHWRRMPDALASDNGDEGCFSGGAFVDDDGTAYLTYWKFPAVGQSHDCGGIQLAYSKPPYEKWERINPIAVESLSGDWGITDIEYNGETVHVGSADPSNIWKKDGYYYMQTGNLTVLNKFGRHSDSEERYKGCWVDLFRSKDLKNWEYRGRFFKSPYGSDYPDETEDAMCPSYLPLPDKKSGGKLTDKMLELFIAHNKGAQYFIGEEHDEKFIIEKHGRLSWKDNCYFAPEALVDDKNRQIAWAWLLNNDPGSYFRDYGWNGTLSFPRCFWLENGELHMAPVDELDRICYKSKTTEIKSAEFSEVPADDGKMCRIKAKIKPNGATYAAFRVLSSEDGSEYTEVGVDFEAGKLYFDATNSGKTGRKIREEAPFALKYGENLELDILIDKSIVEIYSNSRQAICRTVFPSKTSDKIYTVSDGADFGAVEVYTVFPTNFY